MPSLRLVLHPSLATLGSPFAVVSLWAAQQGDGNPSALDPDTPEHAWIVRGGRSVRVLPMSAGDCCFVQALQAGATLGEAAAMAAEGEAGGETGADTSFDLTRCLTVLLREQVLTGVAIGNTIGPRPNHPP